MNPDSAGECIGHESTLSAFLRNRKKSMSHRILNYPQGSSTFPIIKSARHKYLWDTQGRKYLDFYLGAGSQIYGHSCREIVAAIENQLADGMIFAGESDQIHVLGALLETALPNSLTNYVFCSTGTEATTRALRYARLSTGRDAIACFKGGWHGMNEWTLLDGGGRIADFSRNEHCIGIPTILNSQILQLEFNIDSELIRLENHADSLAAVILEPIPGSYPSTHIDYLQRLESICKRHGVLIIYDEVITGFRLGLGGATEIYGLTPDLVTYGKILGGGLPIGLIAMTDEVADSTFLDKRKTTLAGGTFSANPLVAMAACAVLELLRSSDYSAINEQGEFIRSALNTFFISARLPLSMIGTGSISRLLYTDKKVNNRTEREAVEIGTDKQKKIIINFYKKGIYWPPNGIIFNSFCHNDDDIESFVAAVADPLNYEGIFINE
jgi:glutamate-1-semialdehyde 2,1-aminomutase